MSPVGLILRYVLREASPARAPKPKPSDEPVDGSTDVGSAGVARFSAALRSAGDATACTTAFLVAGGLAPEDARRVAEQGLTAQTATDLLSLRLLHPDPSDYGPAVIALSLLTEARSAGELSAEELEARIARLDRAVLLRPDGYLVPALGGQPIERRVDLEPDRIYTRSGGVLRELDGDGTAIAELGLQQAASDFVLDGVEDAARSSILATGYGVAALIDRPEESFDAMFHGFGQLPQMIGRAIRTSPRLLDEYRNASPDEQLRMAGNALAHAQMMASAAAAIPRGSAAFTMSGGPSGFAGGDGLLALQRTATIEVSGAALADFGVRIALGGASLAESLDLFQSPTAGTRLTTLRDPKGRMRVRDRIERTLGDPQDPKLSFGDLEQLVADAKTIDEATHREVKAMILERLQHELASIDDLPDGLRRVKVDRLADFARNTGIDLRDAVRSLARPPARGSLSREAQRALRKLDRGETGVNVSSRAVAEEILSQFSGYIQTPSYRLTEIKKLFGGTDLTFHWDEVFGESGRLLHHGPENPHAKTPHLQLHREKGEVARIFFPR